MSNSDTEFEGKTAFENLECDISGAVVHNRLIEMLAILFQQKNLMKLWYDFQNQVLMLNWWCLRGWGFIEQSGSRKMLFGNENQI